MGHTEETSAADVQETVDFLSSNAVGTNVGRQKPPTIQADVSAAVLTRQSVLLRRRGHARFFPFVPNTNIIIHIGARARGVRTEVVKKKKKLPSRDLRIVIIINNIIDIIFEAGS